MEELLIRSLDLLALALSVAVTLGFLWLRAQVRKIQGDSLAEQALDLALAEASVIAREAVLYTKQTLVDDLRAKSADGKLTKGEAAAALERAYQYFLHHMKAESLRVLEAAFGPLETWVKQLLEVHVAEVKLATEAVAPKSAPASASS